MPPRHLRRRALTERRWLAEPPVELAVSRYIAVVPFLWLDITMTNRGLTSYSSAIQAGHHGPSRTAASQGCLDS
jgi:hypothetical protein